DGIRDFHVTGVQTCALPIFLDLAEAHSLYRDMVDWDELRATADGVQSPGDVSPFIERSVIRTLAQVGDNHSFLLPPFDSEEENPFFEDRKSTRLNSSHEKISYAVF